MEPLREGSKLPDHHFQNIVEQRYPRCLTQPVGTTDPSFIEVDGEPCLSFLIKAADSTLSRLESEIDDITVRWTTHLESNGRLDLAFQIIFTFKDGAPLMAPSLVAGDRPDFREFVRVMRKMTRVVVFVMDEYCAVRDAFQVGWTLDKRLALRLLEWEHSAGITGAKRKGEA